MNPSPARTSAIEINASNLVDGSTVAANALAISVRLSEPVDAEQERKTVEHHRARNRAVEKILDRGFVRFLVLAQKTGQQVRGVGQEFNRQINHQETGGTRDHHHRQNREGKEGKELALVRRALFQVIDGNQCDDDAGEAREDFEEQREQIDRVHPKEQRNVRAPDVGRCHKRQDKAQNREPRDKTRAFLAPDQIDEQNEQAENRQAPIRARSESVFEYQA